MKSNKFEKEKRFRTFMKRIDKSLIYFTLLTKTCARLFHDRPRVRLILSNSNRDIVSDLNSLRLCTRQNIIQTILLSVAVSHSWPLYRFNINKKMSSFMENFKTKYTWINPLDMLLLVGNTCLLNAQGFLCFEVVYSSIIRSKVIALGGMVSSVLLMIILNLFINKLF